MPVAITPPAVTPKNMSTTNLQSKADGNTKRKIICFSDFDGTIFLQDTGHILFDTHGCGPAQRELLDAQIKSGERSFRDVSQELWSSLHVPFDDGFAIMQKTLEIDPDFQKFHKFCIEHNIPFNVISAGLKPVLRKVLDSFLGEEESQRIGIVANDAIINGEDWKPVWRHESELGHDKALSVKEARAQAELECEDGTIPLIVFIGDGVSDLAAAREADVLFARKGLALEEYCKEHGIAYIPYDSFADVEREVRHIMDEDERKTGGKGLPVRFNPRANMWRRLSSKNAVPKLVASTPKEEKMFLWPDTFSELKENKPETVQENIAA